jgi:hypothetical protein
MAKREPLVERANWNNLVDGELVTFSYKAETPGDRDRPRYDSAPVVLVLDVYRKSNKLYLLGMNTNYLTRAREKEIVLLSTADGQPVPLPLFEASVHQYLVSRMTSPLYRVKDFAVSDVVMQSVAAWKQLRR